MSTPKDPPMLILREIYIPNTDELTTEAGNILLAFIWGATIGSSENSRKRIRDRAVHYIAAVEKEAAHGTSTGGAQPSAERKRAEAMENGR